MTSIQILKDVAKKCSGNVGKFWMYSPFETMQLKEIAEENGYTSALEMAQTLVS